MIRRVPALLVLAWLSPEAWAACEGNMPNGLFNDVQANIENLPAGGELCISSGTYDAGDYFLFDGFRSSDFSVRAVDGPGTVTITVDNGEPEGLIGIEGGATGSFDGVILECEERCIDVQNANLELVDVIVRNSANSFSTTPILVANGSFTATDTRFSYNGRSTTLGGGALELVSSPGVLTRVTFDNNEAEEGAALFLRNSDLDCDSCVFSQNSGDRGAGIFVESSGTPTISITNSTFTSNAASGRGGAIFSNESLAISGSTFTSNTSVNSGGAIKMLGTATAVVTGSTFELNESTGRDGGAIDSDAAVDISGSTFLDNVAFEDGGAVRDRNDSLKVSIISDSVFAGNTASQCGGAVCGSPTGAGLLGGYFTLRDNLFADNSAMDGGGVGMIEVFGLTFDGNTLLRNGSSDDGAGLYVESIQDLDIVRNEMCGNTSSSEGGGLYAADPQNEASIWSLNNNIFSLNSSVADGAGVHIDGVTPTLTVVQNTFLANDGRGFHGANSDTLFDANAVAWHTDSDGAAWFGGSSDLSNNLWWDNVTDANRNTGSKPVKKQPFYRDFTVDTTTCPEADIAYYTFTVDPTIDQGIGTDLDSTTADIGAYGGSDSTPEAWDDSDSDGVVALYDCDDSDAGTAEGTEYYQDADGDGFGDANVILVACSQPGGFVTDDQDCDDTDSTATLVSDYYDDSDGDGYGDSAGVPTTACLPPSGSAANAEDCDDQDPDVNPDTVWVLDTDGDGYGAEGSETTQCASPGLDYIVGPAGDCEDGDIAINPAANEVCNGDVDDDCNGTADEADSGIDPGELTDWYEDGDGDGYGAGSAVSDCDPPGSAWVDQGGDCNDGEPAEFPGATWYADTDTDGFGNPNDELTQCAQPSGYVADDQDCDDDDITTNPNTEWWPDLDGDGYGDGGVAPTAQCTAPVDYVRNTEDCDDNPTDGDLYTPNTVWYQDIDADGYGVDSSALTQCTSPGGNYVVLGGDCDDSPLGVDVNPGEAEVCDNVDNNCDTEIDEADDDIDPQLLTDWYPDLDGDGYGDEDVSPTTSCFAPVDTVADGTDCDDTDENTFLGAPELCDGVDNDCSGAPETQSEVQYVDWFVDTDDDGVGDGPPTNDCQPPSDGQTYSQLNGDCNNSDATIRPGADEECDGVDQDCDNVVDNDPIDGDTYYEDADGDGYGTVSSPISACSEPSGYTDVVGDCDDTNADVSPVGLEVCDGVDQDCNNSIDDSAIDAAAHQPDDDGDGFGDPDEPTVYVCPGLPGLVEDATDCDDLDASTYPGATEQCDGKDNDCDDEIDESVQDQTWYADADGDGFGDDGDTILDCTIQDDRVLVGGDCDDTDPTISPDATEVWYDGVDDNCDGNDDDQDEDGFVAEGSGGDDCDDIDDTVYPGATEIGGDGIDQDCDGDDGAKDSDGDGIPDDVEGTDDVDGDGIPNDQDLDSDGDGASDSAEGTGDKDEDGIPDFLDPGGDTPGAPIEANYGYGCGCDSSSPGGHGLLVLALLFGIRRRR